jgi:hypothetical protein
VTGANEAYEETLLQALAAGLRERFDAARAAGRDPAHLGEPAELAGRMLAAVPAVHPWDDQIGPFYDTAGLTRWLGVTKQALADRVRRHRLLAVITAEGRVLYPAAQFAGRRVLPGLPEALVAFRDTEVDGWAIAAWATTPAAALRGSTPLRWLRDGGDAGPVLALARQTAALWAA